MAINFDKALALHSQALRMGAQRAEVIAVNLANADTPNYLAKDTYFRDFLVNAQRQIELRASHKEHIGQGSGQETPELLYRVPDQPAIDGNTVDVQLEQALFSENAVRYQTSLSFLKSRISGLLSAIRGE